jgi:hypothetical protein
VLFGQLNHHNKHNIDSLTISFFITQYSALDYGEEHLKWLTEGSKPFLPDPIPEPEPLTPQQKLEAAGLSIEELKELLGL